MTSKSHEQEQNQEDVDRLIHLVIEQRASDAEQRELEQLLRADSTARRRYAQYMQMHAMLQWEHTSVPEAAQSRPTLRDRTITRNQFAVGAAIALALCASLLVVAFTRLNSNRTDISTPLAQVRSSGGARWAGADNLIQVGDELSPGKYDLAAGALDVRLRNGVAMVLESPVRFRLQSDMRILLRSGRMVAKVPKQAVGFTIETSRAEVVDLGTEFGVAIGPRDETLVQVFDGEVVTEFKQAGSNDNQRRHLRAGSAIQIESGEGTANVRELSFAKDRFVRQLPKLGHDAYTWLPPYNANHHEELHIVPADSEVVIDGDLADWNQSRKFVTHLREPYGKDYYVEGMMMYDRHNVYIGAHIGDPAPMRSVVGPELEPELFWKGGGLQVRLSTDPALGWPLDARSSISRDRSNPEAGSRPKDNSPNIVHMTMWFYRPAAQPCLALQYGMNFEPLVINPQGWQGAFREDPDGRGYRLEYAIPWSLLHDSARAPRPGDELGVCWQVHWSDDGGRMWRGHLVELTRPGVDGLAFLRADMWGRAIYHAALDPPPRDKALKTQPE